jgi:hypothetical protein
MILLFRLIDKRTGQVVIPEKIEFHLGRPIIINGFSASVFDIELTDLEKGWVPVTWAFGREVKPPDKEN